MSEQAKDRYDWSAHDKYSKNEVECRGCGTVFVSHSRFDGARIMVVSRDPCPKCGGDELQASRSRWESNKL